MKIQGGCRTESRSRKRTRKILLVSLSFLFSAGLFAAADSVEEEIAKINVEKLNAKAADFQTRRIHFHQLLDTLPPVPESCRDLLPLSGTQNWYDSVTGKAVLSPENRRKVLDFYASKEGILFFEKNAEIIRQITAGYSSGPIDPEMEKELGNYLSLMSRLRDTIRHIGSAAILAKESGHPEKVLPLLEPLESLEETLAKDPSILSRLMQLAFTGTRFRLILSIAPDDPAYLPSYEALLKRFQEQKFQAPDETEWLQLNLIRRKMDGRSNAILQDAAKKLRDHAQAVREISALAKEEVPKLPETADIGLMKSMCQYLIRWKMTHSMFVTGLALKIHKVKFGEYPKDLNELTAKKILPLLPRLPQDGKIPEYQRLDDGAFLLWDQSSHVFTSRMKY